MRALGVWVWALTIFGSWFVLIAVARFVLDIVEALS